MLKPYLIRDSYSAQIEAHAIVGLRVGYTCLGIAAWPPKGRKRARFLPGVRLTLWSHTGQNDQVTAFKLTVLGRSVGFITRGETTPGHYRFADAGWFAR